MRVVLATAAIALLVAPTASARPLDRLDARLRDLATGAAARQKAAPGAPTVRPAGAPVRSGRVLVDVYVRGAMRDGAAALRDEGMQVEALSGRSPQRIVEGWVPVSRLDAIAALPQTRAVVAVQEPIYNTGAVTSEGDAVHRGPQVRAQGPTGAGIPVGIMSDSINRRGGGVAGSQASGDLPADVQILDEPAMGTDEGRAMAEIVYDEAPGIPRIIFARGGGGAAVRAANIDALVAAGARVIADDVVYLGEPFFQDGIIAQAADRAKAAGVAYFVSAGNRARQSWEGTFTPSSVPAEHDFDTGAGEDRRQTIATVPSGQSLFVYVQWANPFGAATDDFALDFYNANTAAPLGTVDSDNVATGIPREIAELPGGGGGTAYAMTIRRVAGSGNPRLKWIANGAFTGALPAEHDVQAPAIDPDAASARGALAVAAVRHSDAGLDTVESFSSRGPSVTRFFGPTGTPLATPDVRPKPDVAAADGVATTIDGTVGGPDFNPFFGTSAAAPSAAGVAALLLSARPSMSVDQLYAILRDPRGSVDCTAPGFPDADCGSGFLLADGKLNMVLDPTPPDVAAVLSPGAPDGTNGWYRGNVGLSWNVADAGSPISSQTGCGPQSVTADGVVSFTCSALSAGGTTTRTVEVKRDASPPGAPVIAGIGAGPFTSVSLPEQSAVSCSASDPTSGVGSCAVSGYSAALGSHTLTATAVNGAGLSSSSQLTYSVVRPAAIGRRLTVPGRVRGRSLLRSGVLVRLNAALDDTALDGRLLRGRRTVGRRRATVARGARRVRIRLTAAGQRDLRRALLRSQSVRLAVRVRASAPGAAAVTRRATITVLR